MLRTTWATLREFRICLISFMFGTCSLASGVPVWKGVGDGCFDNLRETHRQSSSLWPEAIFALSKIRHFNYLPRPLYKLLVTITSRVKFRLMDIFPPAVIDRELHKPQTDDGGENVFWNCKFLFRNHFSIIPRCLTYYTPRLKHVRAAWR